MNEAAQGPGPGALMRAPERVRAGLGPPMTSARREPTIAGAIEMAGVLIERLEVLDASLGGTLAQMRGPQPEGEDAADRNPCGPGLFAELEDRLGTMLRIVNSLEPKAAEIERMAGVPA